VECKTSNDVSTHDRRAAGHTVTYSSTSLAPCHVEYLWLSKNILHIYVVTVEWVGKMWCKASGMSAHTNKRTLSLTYTLNAASLGVMCNDRSSTLTIYPSAVYKPLYQVAPFREQLQSNALKFFNPRN
jgi:hypothetical protein